MTRDNLLKYLLFICNCLVTINEQCVVSKLPRSDSLHVVNYTERYVIRLIHDMRNFFNPVMLEGSKRL